MNIIQGLKDYLLLNKHLYRLSEKEVKETREKLLFETVNHALKHSRFYRELYGIETLTSMKEFYNFPIINKTIMMENFNDLNTSGLNLEDVTRHAVEKELAKDYTGYYKDDYVIGMSSGTSGNKGIYVTPKSLTQRLPFVFLARGGIPLKMLPFRILFLLRVFSQGFADINAPIINITYKSTMTDPEQLIDTINQEKINIIMAPPSMFRILMQSQDKIKVKLKLLVSYAEVLEKEDKERISKAFNTKIHEIYQTSEGQIASTCKCGNLHINEDLVFIELYDKDNLPVTTPHITAHRMILTNLVNHTQPLIRYEMNDIVELGEKCACGSNFRVISKIIGRNDDVLIFKNSKGKIVHVFPDLFARWIITQYDAIREFKVIQHTPDQLEIMIDVPNSNDLQDQQICNNLELTISSELKAFDIDCKPIITITKIALPETKSKYKRFERRF